MGGQGTTTMNAETPIAAAINSGATDELAAMARARATQNADRQAAARFEGTAESYRPFGEHSEIAEISGQDA